nr:hypothetical protein [uncultured Roseateles sp.]
MPTRSAFFRHRRGRQVLALLWMSLVLVPVTGWLLSPSGTKVQLVHKTWHLAIEVETWVVDHGSNWCDELPAGAHITLRRTIVDPSGARTAPADHCRYTALQWRALHSAMAEGEAPAAPRWPVLQLLPASDPPALGAERAGKRHERYEVLLRAASGQEWTCRLALPHWQGLAPGLSFRLKVDRHGVANCSSVPGSSPT